MKSSFFFFVFLLVFLLAPFISKAQAGYEDAVYLKSGAIIYGTIIENIPNDHVTIKTEDGNLLKNNWKGIYKITKVTSSGAKKLDTTFYEKGVRMHGFMNFTELNTGLSKLSRESYFSKPSFCFGTCSIGAYGINPNFNIGAGIGYDNGDNLAFLPMFLDFRLKNLGDSKTGIVLFDIGYSPEIENSSEYLGGIMIKFGLNKALPKTKKGSIIFGIGFCRQYYTYFATGFNLYLVNNILEPYYYKIAEYYQINYLRFNLGFSFN